MANFVSPGVYTIEKDISDYAPSINTSIVGIVGFADKGPTNKATLITSQNNLIDTFGEPREAINGQALEGALEILETTNSVYFVRAVDDDTSSDASATMSIGTCPAVLVSGHAAAADGGWGVDREITFRIQVTNEAGVDQFLDNGGAGKDFTVSAPGTIGQAAALRKVLGGSLDSDLVGVFDDGNYTAGGLGLSGAIVGSFAGSGASLSISACTGPSFDAAFGVSALRYINPLSGTTAYGVSGLYASAIKVYGSQYAATGTNSCSYLLESIHPGAGYNGGTKSDGTTSGNSITVNSLGGPNFTVVINENGTAIENFKTAFVASGAFIEDVINTGEVDLKSKVIKGNLVKDDVDVVAAEQNRHEALISALLASEQFTLTHKSNPPTATNWNGTDNSVTQSYVTDDGGRFNKLVGASTAQNMTGGQSGLGSTESDRAVALIGDAATDPKTGMQALDDSVLNIGLALVPGIQTQSVQNALITLAETTQDFLALVSPPYAVGTVQDAIDWTNGRAASTGSRTAAINSSYAAVHWPWLKVFSTFDGIDRWFDPSIYAVRQMAYTDAVSDSWFAPAGFRRGRLTKPTETEVKLNQGDRDSLYSGGNVINPIVAFPQQGITIFGQRTTQREPTALDRINVRRLMIYIRKVILRATQRFVFEPNDEFTWAEIEGVLNPFLDDIRRRRGITEFRVVCDETVNTPLRVDRNELWTKVLIKPTKTAEILVFELNLTNQSAQLGTL
jgi:phage tail sheath protein FI